MIYVTGDTHGNNDILKLYDLAAKTPGLDKDDYVIIAGDFGGVWNRKTLFADLNNYSNLPFTTLFVDGNHENYDLLRTFPVNEWNGGKVQMIRPDIIHLMRGQVYEIDGRTFFTFGGATSIDKYMRREGLSWWSEERPSDDELREGIDNLKRFENNVDYIITHSCDEKALWYPPLRTREFKMGVYPENQMLSYFEDILTYRHWYFGHYHMDADLTEKKTVLYQKIVRLR